MRVAVLLLLLPIVSLQAAPEPSALDAIMREEMRKSGALGAAVVIVKDGRIIVLRGYGHADFDRRRPVIPEQTVFFAASISKLFVATAIMQLVEEGKIRVSDGVNRYFSRFQLDHRFSQPVTIAHLLTHTGGLDDHMLGAEAPIGSSARPLEDYFARYTPRRVRPPGTQFNYSNHGMALAGLIVEKVSGVPFDRYVQEHILGPLHMTRSTFAQPVPASLQRDLAAERFSKPRELPYPVVTLVTTAADMAHFMIAHLEGGEYNGAHILSPASVATMQQKHFTPDPNLPGVAYGFFEAFHNDRRALFHTGARDHFSVLYLVPGDHFGVYLAFCGTPEGSGIEARVLHRLLNQYFPNGTRPATTQLLADRQHVSGRYRLNFLPITSIEKLAAIAGDVSIRAEHGALVLGSPGFGSPHPPRRLMPLMRAPNVYSDGEETFVTFRTSNGEHEALLSHFIDDPTSLRKLAWYETSPVQLGLGLTGVVTFAGFLLYAIGTRIRRRYRHPDAQQAWFWRLGILASLLVLIAPVNGVIGVLLTHEHQLYAIPPILYGVLTPLLFLAFLAPVIIAITIAAWRESYWSASHRIAYTVLGGACAGSVPYLWYWNLLGYNF